MSIPACDQFVTLQLQDMPWLCIQLSSCICLLNLAESYCAVVASWHLLFPWICCLCPQPFVSVTIVVPLLNRFCQIWLPIFVHISLPEHIWHDPNKLLSWFAIPPFTPSLPHARRNKNCKTSLANPKNKNT